MWRSELLVVPLGLFLLACDDVEARGDDAASGTSSSSSSSSSVDASSSSSAEASSGAGASSGSGGGVVAPVRSEVRLTTADGLALTGFLTTAATTPDGGPGVVLVHQFQRDAEQWGDLPEVLAGAGYRTLAFDLRGHGDSDAYDGPLTDLLIDPDGAPRDVGAAVAALGGELGADPDRIGVIGTSIGANLAVVASLSGMARSVVAISARREPIEALAGRSASGMTSAFYLAAELDAGGQAADAQLLFEASDAPRDIEVFADVADHGIDLLINQPEVRPRIQEWLAATL